MRTADAVYVMSSGAVWVVFRGTSTGAAVGPVHREPNKDRAIGLGETIANNYQLPLEVKP